MGHGYFTVVGFGIVVPVDLFLDQLSEDDAETLDEAVEHVEDDFDVKIHREEQEETVNVFVTTKGAIWVDARGAGGSAEVVDPVKINEGHQDLRNFAARYFPELPIQLTVYSYEGN